VTVQAMLGLGVVCLIERMRRCYREMGCLCSSGASRVRPCRVHPDAPQAPMTRLAPLLQGHYLFIRFICAF
jgi:hypothetical protein